MNKIGLIGSTASTADLFVLCDSTMIAHNTIDTWQDGMIHKVMLRGIGIIAYRRFLKAFIAFSR
jgi:hypothetical protein